MDVTTSGEKEAGSSANQPTAESLSTSPPRGKRSTKPELTANDRLEIAQQALIDLGHAGLRYEVSEIHDQGETYIGIIIYGARYDAGRLVAINGNKQP